MSTRRRFPDMEHWLEMIESWWHTVEAAVRMNVSPGMLETVLRAFPAYPEDTA